MAYDPFADMPVKSAQATLDALGSALQSDDKLSEAELATNYLKIQRRNMIVNILEGNIRLDIAENELKDLLSSKDKSEESRKRQGALGDEIGSITKNITAYKLRLDAATNLLRDGKVIKELATYDALTTSRPEPTKEVRKKA